MGEDIIDMDLNMEGGRKETDEGRERDSGRDRSFGLGTDSALRG